MKPTIWIFSLEPLETRYTAQWYTHVPQLLANKLGDKFNVINISGTQKASELTPGAFLNFSDTNYWKSSQLCNFLEHHNNGLTSPNDHIIFTDAWNPTAIQIKYMSDLLGFNWILHGLWHAGSYDPQDFLGRLVGDANWVRHAEKSFFYAFDHNYFATDFHIEMFRDNLFGEDAFSYKSITRSGWPMEYMVDVLAPFKNIPKRDLILFPHRIAPEKQVEIFRDLALQLPQYEFIVCQDQKLTKDEYHTLLGQSKIVFSANLQETLGITTCAEGPLLNAIPLAPDRLSYTEIFKNHQDFLYPSEWTMDWEHYVIHRTALVSIIKNSIENYYDLMPAVNNYINNDYKRYFYSDILVNNIK